MNGKPDNTCNLLKANTFEFLDSKSCVQVNITGMRVGYNKNSEVVSALDILAQICAYDVINLPVQPRGVINLTRHVSETSLCIITK